MPAQLSHRETKALFIALADEERHGNAIMREVTDRTSGEVQIGPGTMYDSIKRMLAAGSGSSDSKLGTSKKAPPTTMSNMRAPKIHAVRSNSSSGTKPRAS